MSHNQLVFLYLCPLTLLPVLLCVLHFHICLGTDLDTIRACFSEKEKELSIAVAKVEALTRQLEELRRGRRGFVGLAAPQDGGNQQQPPQHATVTRELEKLRRELMVSVLVSVISGSNCHRLTYFHANYSPHIKVMLLLHILSSLLSTTCSVSQSTFTTAGRTFAPPA